MSVSIRFLPQRKLAVSMIRGRFSYQDLLEHRRRVAHEPHYDASYRLLFDARRVTELRLSGDQIRQFADFSQPGQPRFARMAIVVSNDLAFGMSRVFQAYTGRHTEDSLRIFRDAKQAWAWLKEEPA